MKILILSTYDVNGGAAKATFRLYKALIENNVKCKMLVQQKDSNENDIYMFKKNSAIVSNLLSNDNLLDTFYKNRQDIIFSTGIFGENISKNKLVKQADIIHLNWINNDFISIKSLNKINKPIVWTLHDMWPFTGGCHYTGECDKYKSKCKNCPILNSNKNHDLSAKIFNLKEKHYSKDIVIVTLNKWMQNCVKNSKLFKFNKVIKIPNTIDTNIFKPPYDKLKIRSTFNIKQRKFVILFGAANALYDKRKGFKFLKEAINLIVEKNVIDNLEIIVFGSNYCKTVVNPKVTYRYLGKINDENKLAQIYSMSDVFVIPSLEDNLPNTILESLSCVTPVVGFNIGGIPNLIEHKINGYLAKYKSSEDLAQGIYWIYKNNQNNWLGKNGRDKIVKNNNNDIIAKQYIDLYKSLLK